MFVKSILTPGEMLFNDMLPGDSIAIIGLIIPAIYLKAGLKKVEWIIVENKKAVQKNMNSLIIFIIFYYWLVYVIIALPFGAVVVPGWPL